MDAEVRNSTRTLIYSKRQFILGKLWIGLAVLLAGLALHRFGGRGIDQLALVLSVIGLGGITYIAWIALTPPKPELILSPKGLVLRQYSSEPIPWRDIKGVSVRDHTFRVRARNWRGYVNVTHKNLILFTVSTQLFDKHPGQRSLVSGLLWGEASHIDVEVGVGLFIFPEALSTPHAELFEAITTRWRAFNRDAPKADGSLAIVAPVAMARRPPARRRDGVRGADAGHLLRDPREFTKLALPVIGLAVVGANYAGIWMTQGQREALAQRLRYEEEIRKEQAERKARDDQWTKLWRDFDKSFERTSPERPMPKQTTAPNADGHKSPVNAIAASPDGRMLASSGLDGDVRLWSLTSGKFVRLVADGRGMIAALTFMRNGGRLAVAGSDGRITFHDTNSSAVTGSIDASRHGSLLGFAISPGGSTAYTTHSNSLGLLVWNLASGEQTSTVTTADRDFNIALSPDETWVVADGLNGKLRIRSLRSSSSVERTFGSAAGSYRPLVTPDGKHVVSSDGDDTLRLWDAATGTEVRSFTGHTSPVDSIAISRDGKRLLSGSNDGTARLWDIATGRELSKVSDSEMPVLAVTFGPDNWLLTAGFGKAIKSWRPSGGQPVQVFAGAPDP